MSDNIITQQILEEFLSEVPELEDYIRETEIRLEPSYLPPFNYLLRSIIYQQLSGKAAGTIYQRFLDLVAPVTPEKLLTFQQEKLRSVGLSRQKAGYVQNVANAFVKGGDLERYNSVDEMKNFSNKEIIELFTTIKGVGEWTVQMYLIFGLGRLNVFAAKDLGIRNGVAIMYDLDETPTPGKAKLLTKHWERYATVGSILCWRIQD